MRLGNIVALFAAGVFFVGSAAGCKKKVTKPECARCADKGADLKLDEDPHWGQLSLTQKATYKATARNLLERSNSDLQQVNRCEPDDFTYEEYECAIKAKTFNEWDACIN